MYSVGQPGDRLYPVYPATAAAAEAVYIYIYI